MMQMVVTMTIADENIVWMVYELAKGLVYGLSVSNTLHSTLMINVQVTTVQFPVIKCDVPTNPTPCSN